MLLLPIWRVSHFSWTHSVFKLLLLGFLSSCTEQGTNSPADLKVRDAMSSSLFSTRLFSNPGCLCNLQLPFLPVSSVMLPEASLASPHFSTTLCLASQLPPEPHHMPDVGKGAEKKSILRKLGSRDELFSLESWLLQLWLPWQHSDAFKNIFLIWKFYPAFLRELCYKLTKGKIPWLYFKVNSLKYIDIRHKPDHPVPYMNVPAHTSTLEYILKMESVGFTQERDARWARE